MEVQAIGAILVSIIIGLISVVYWINRNEISKLNDTVDDLKTRVQRIEDVQGNSIEGLKEDVKELSHKVDKLTDNVQSLTSHVHNHKNTEGQLTQTLNLILKHLQKE